MERVRWGGELVIVKFYSKSIFSRWIISLIIGSFGFWVFYWDELVKHAKMNGLDTVTYMYCREYIHTHSSGTVSRH